VLSSVVVGLPDEDMGQTVHAIIEVAEGAPAFQLPAVFQRPPAVAVQVDTADAGLDSKPVMAQTIRSAILDLRRIMIVTPGN